MQGLQQSGRMTDTSQNKPKRFNHEHKRLANTKTIGTVLSALEEME
jgi:hypothetical protein